MAIWAIFRGMVKSFLITFACLIYTPPGAVMVMVTNIVCMVGWWTSSAMRLQRQSRSSQRECHCYLDLSSLCHSAVLIRAPFVTMSCCQQDNRKLTAQYALCVCPMVSCGTGSFDSCCVWYWSQDQHHILVLIFILDVVLSGLWTNENLARGTRQNFLASGLLKLIVSFQSF